MAKSESNTGLSLQGFGPEEAMNSTSRIYVSYGRGPSIVGDVRERIPVIWCVCTGITRSS